VTADKLQVEGNLGSFKIDERGTMQHELDIALCIPTWSCTRKVPNQDLPLLYRREICVEKNPCGVGRRSTIEIGLDSETPRYIKRNVGISLIDKKTHVVLSSVRSTIYRFSNERGGIWKHAWNATATRNNHERS